ncbi:unnamed protein product [Fusarium equiseti]|uniref:Uncharacterized protein n=1 Tax=Fusarium equiseti TaxID=61235 RepID=A0A8J2NN77_FUSEQ|nr:unnamed protein product [Fusarium equiseti]
MPATKNKKPATKQPATKMPREYSDWKMLYNRKDRPFSFDPDFDFEDEPWDLCEIPLSKEEKENATEEGIAKRKKAEAKKTGIREEDRMDYPIEGYFLKMKDGVYYPDMKIEQIWR